MLKVFIGFDSNEPITFGVLSHSIMRHSSIPVSITPLYLPQLPISRLRDENQSTDFAYSRFLVPWLCNYEGKAIFMDSDMLFRDDIASLIKEADESADVSVVKHDYTPKNDIKFLGQRQTTYEKKNWSSLMVFNNWKCHRLTVDVVNKESGMYLHQFHWADKVGEISKDWNHLVGEYEPNKNAKNVHFTLGAPCFKHYFTCEFSKEWRDECKMMTYHNPIGEYAEKYGNS
tara:strand:- start:813 stop:1502 length:690 start_codon:yes stop_codon:yes gene_type:complete